MAKRKLSLLDQGNWTEGLLARTSIALNINSRLEVRQQYPFVFSTSFLRVKICTDATHRRMSKRQHPQALLRYRHMTQFGIVSSRVPKGK